MTKRIEMWVVILTALIVVVMLIVPSTPKSKTDSAEMGAGGCTHEMTCQDLLKMSVMCNICNQQRPVTHRDIQLDCYHARCEDCFRPRENEAHMEWCSGNNQCLTCGNNIEEYIAKNPEQHVVVSEDKECAMVSFCKICRKEFGTEELHYSFRSVLLDPDKCLIGEECTRCAKLVLTRNHDMESHVIGCKLVESCSICGKTGETIGESHVWKSVSCGSGATCEKCGIRRVKSTVPHTWVRLNYGCVQESYCEKCGYESLYTQGSHTYDNPFLRVFGKCTVCGWWQFQAHRYDWLSRVAEVLGVFLIAFAFQYVIRKRKFIHFKWLIVMFMWLEENTHFGNFCPAVLWKKKLN